MKPTAAHQGLYVLFLASITASQLLVLRVGIFTVGDVLLVATLALACSTALLEGRARIELSTVMLALGITIACAMASSGAIDPEESMTVAARLVLLIAVVPGLAVYLLTTKERIVGALVALGVGGAASGAAGIAQLLVPSLVIPGSMVTNSGRYAGLTGHVSDQGGVTSIALVALIGVMIASRGRRRVVAILLSPVVLGGLVLSGSVSGMIAVIGSIALLIVVGTMRLRYLLLSALVGVPSLYFALQIQSTAGVALDPVERLLLTIGQTDDPALAAGGASTESRLDTYAVAIDRWINAGFTGNGLDPASATVVGNYPAHNILVATAFEGGILLLVLLTYAMLRPFFGRWIHPRTDLLSGVLLSVGVAAITFAMTAPSLYNRYMWVPIAIVWAGRALARSPKSDPSTDDPSVTQMDARNRMLGIR